MFKSKIVNTVFSLFAAMLILPFTTSCDDSFIFDHEDDCRLKVKFEFRKHRQALQTVNGIGTDVFVNTVASVHLFVLDSETGELVYERAENADNLIAGSMMPVDLAPGRYTFIAWCGLDPSDENNAFKLHHSYTRGLGDKCAVKMSGDIHPVNHAQYEAVYHGITKDFTVTLDNIDTVVPVELTKDTNDIHVWIQYTGGELNDKDYEVVYVDSNGEMDFSDNSLVAEHKELTYKAYKTSILDTETEYNGSQMSSGALIAHLSVARLMDSHSANAKIVVRNKEGKEVFSIPFIKYIMELQDVTGDNQYYLDCEDTYNCSFFIGGERPDGTWIPYSIIVNNWTKVPDQQEEI